MLSGKAVSISVKTNIPFSVYSVFEYVNIYSITKTRLLKTLKPMSKFHFLLLLTQTNGHRPQLRSHKCPWFQLYGVLIRQRVSGECFSP